MGREPRTVELVKSTYQPTKAEMEEELDLSHLEGQTPEEMAKAIVEPVTIKQIPKPRN